MVAVVGKPIDVTKVEHPTNEQVIELHTKFVTELKALYDRHKHRMGSDWARKYNRLYLEDEKPAKSAKFPSPSFTALSPSSSSTSPPSPSETKKHQ
jgi:hypothetical protein